MSVQGVMADLQPGGVAGGCGVLVSLGAAGLQQWATSRDNSSSGSSVESLSQT